MKQGEADYEKALKRLDKAGAIPHPRATEPAISFADQTAASSGKPRLYERILQRISRKLQSINHIISLLSIFNITDIYKIIRLKIGTRNLQEFIKIKNMKAPEVSIIIPTYNKPSLLIQAIVAVARIQSKISYEIIVVDNGNNSTLKKIFSVAGHSTYVATGKNLGFVEACNAGAGKARGQILVFLNDDTRVLGGWLDRLVETLQLKNVGVVGSKLIYPDATLQESGGIIFDNASGNNYGKFQDPLDFKFNNLCKVDYVSGASLAITKRLFLHLGMFDTELSPAYYEDTDLCFQVRAAGYQVLCQPLSVVVHIEGATSGTDTNTGYKKYQEINRKKFQKKWKKELSRHRHATDNLFLARTRQYKSRILFIDNSLPEPDKDSGSLREFTILKILTSLGYFVTFWPKDLVAKPNYTSPLQQMGIEVAYGNVDFHEFIKERQSTYTYVFFARPYVAAHFIKLVRGYQPQAKLIFDTVDLHFLRVQRQAALHNDSHLNKIARDWEIVEKSLIEQVDTTLVVSSDEKKILENAGYQNIDLLSNVHDVCRGASGFASRKNLLFIGSFAHPPNADGVIWFCQKILPIIRRSIADVNINIIGSGDITKLDMIKNLPGVNILGFVDDVKPHFDQSRVFVAPLRYGAGVKGKIGQSMSLGLPLVTTLVGAEGLHLKNSRDCFISDDEQQFADYVIRLYNDKSISQKMQKGSYEIIEAHYSPEKTKQDLIRILGD
jgi:GT2 family glycosyltransferase